MSIRINAVDKYITRITNLLDYNKDYTVIIRFKLSTTLVETWPTLFSVNQSVFDGSLNYDYIGFNSDASRLRCGAKNSASSDSNIDGTTPLIRDKWYHAALVRRGNTLSQYLDGRLENSCTLDISTRTDAAGHNSIGKFYNTYSQYSGSLSNFKSFTRALSSQDILQDSQYNDYFINIKDDLPLSATNYLRDNRTGFIWSLSGTIISEPDLVFSKRRKSLFTTIPYVTPPASEETFTGVTATAAASCSATASSASTAIRTCVAAVSDSPRSVAANTKYYLFPEPQNLFSANTTYGHDNVTYWSAGANTVTNSVGQAADGSFQADKVVPNTGTLAHYIQAQSGSNSFVAGKPYLAVTYAKADGYRYVQIGFSGGSHSTNAWQNFDLVNGTVETGGGDYVERGIVDIGNGWYRVWFSSNAANTTSSSMGFFFGACPAANSGRVTIWTPNGTDGFRIWRSECTQAVRPMFGWAVLSSAAQQVAANEAVTSTKVTATLFETFAAVRPSVRILNSISKFALTASVNQVSQTTSVTFAKIASRACVVSSSSRTNAAIAKVALAAFVLRAAPRIVGAEAKIAANAQSVSIRTSTVANSRKVSIGNQAISVHSLIAGGTSKVAAGTGVFGTSVSAFNSFVSTTAKIARPISDTVKGTWVPSSGNDLAPMIDEVTLDLLDYISTTQSGDICRMRLNMAVDPKSSAGQVVSYTGSGSFIARLRQNTTLIAEWTETGLNETTVHRSLTTGECDSITDYGDLFIEFESV